MAGQGTTGTGDKSQATQSFFVFVRDNSTGQITSVTVPGDMQIGLNGNPADLTLLGRLAVAAKNYDVTFANKGILQTSPDDTIIGVSLVTTPMSGRVTLYLSQSPREGELHFVKDLTGTSDTVPIDIYPTSGYSIDGKSKVTLNDPTASLAIVFLNGNWYRLVAGLGASGGSGADPLAEYVLLAGDAGLPNSRTLQVATNLTMTDTGPAGTITLNLSQILGSGAGTYTYATVTADAFGRITGIANGTTPPPANASYVTALSEPALSNRRLLTGTRGVFATDGGPASTMGLSIDPSYFIAQGNVSIFVQNGNLVISGSNSSSGFQNAPAQAQYLLLQLTSALPQGRLVTPGRGINTVDSGPNNNFTINVNDNVVAMVSGTTFTGRIQAPSITGTLGIVAQGLATGGGFSGTLQTLADGRTRYLVGIGSVTVTTQSNGQVIISGSGGTSPVTNITGAGGTSVSSVGTLFTVSSSIYADDYASYIITSGSSNQPPNARKLVGGSQVSLVDGGPGGSLTINVSASVVASSSTGANLYASYLLVNPDAEDVNARTIAAGANITFTDGGPGGSFTISSTGGGGGGASGPITTITGSAIIYQGHCTGSIIATATSVWTDFTSFVPNFFDVVQSGITRNTATFTVNTTGYYHFHSDFNTAGNTQYFGWRLSGSNGTILQQTHYDNNDASPGEILDGIVFLNSGSTFKLQYVTKTGTTNTWGVADPIGTAPDSENMRTGLINIFLINPQNLYVTANVTGSGALTVLTASLTSSVNIPFNPAIVQLATITSSFTDVMVFAKASGISAGANTIWFNVLVDGKFFKELASFTETNQNGSGWGNAFSGEILGLAPGTHTFTLQATKGSNANTPTIDPNSQLTAGGSSGQYQGATLMIMNLTGSTNSFTAINGYTFRHTPADSNVLHEWPCTDVPSSTTLTDIVDSAPMTIDNSQVPGTPILVGQTGIFDGSIWTFGNANSAYTTNNISEPPSSSFSIDCWIQWGSNGGNQYIFGRQWKDPLDGSNFSCISLATTGQGSLGYWITLAGGAEVGGYSKFNEQGSGIGTWHHVGLTFDGANVRLYWDGDHVFTEARVGNVDFSFPAPWFLGQFKTTPGTVRSFTGKIADARVHSVVRPDSYFRSLYQLGIGFASASAIIIVSGSGGGGGSNFIASGAYTGPNAWVEGGIAAFPQGNTQIRTTSSVAISDGTENFFAGMKGKDIYFYASGTVAASVGGSSPAKTVFGGDTVISGSLNVQGSLGITGSITQMPNGNPYIIGLGATKILTNSVGQIVVSSSAGGSGGTSGINVQNQGATLPASPYQTINFTGPGVTTTDIGGVATVNIPGATPGNVPGSFASYYGYCTGSLLWSATGSWTNALNVPGNFTDGISVNVLRNGSTFTVTQTGLYNFRSFFNAMAGANGTYIAFRLSGSNGPIISRTTFATDNQQPAILEGLMQLNSGSSFTLQYLTSGSVEQPWTPSDPNGIGVDTANMRTGEIGIFLVPSGSATVNNYAITASVSPNAYSPANYAINTSSNAYNFDSSVAGFQPVPNMSSTITTSGYPVLVMVNANYVSRLNGSQAFFSVTRDSINLGTPAGGLMGAGPLQNTYNLNASLAFVDFVAAGTHTYQFTALGSIGSGSLTAQGVGPGGLMVFEMKGANVVTASTSQQLAVPGGDVTGLSASIFVNRGPVLAIYSGEVGSDAGGNWCWNTIKRNGTSLGSTFGIGLTVGSSTNEMQNMTVSVLDTAANVGATNTYTVAYTNGAGTNTVNRNNTLSSLILWELSDVNYKYATFGSDTTLGASYTDVVPTTPINGLVTRGRPVLLIGTTQSNTQNTAARSAWSFLRNGSSITSASKGFQLVDGENTNDWNRVPSTFWIDAVPAGFYKYQFAGFNLSGSSDWNQGPTLSTFFMYELDPGGPGVIIDGWFDEGNFLFTTASIQALGNAQFGNTTVTQLTQVGSNVLSVFSGSLTILGTLTFASGSGMAITGSSVSRQYNIPFLSAMVTSPQFSGSKANLGVHWFDPTKLNTGIDTLTYKFRSLFAPVFGNGNAYVDLYDYTGIITGFPGPVSGSVLTASLPSTLVRQEADITNVLAGVTGSGILLARAWVDPSGSNFVNVGGTELILEWH